MNSLKQNFLPFKYHLTPEPYTRLRFPKGPKMITIKKLSGTKDLRNFQNVPFIRIFSAIGSLSRNKLKNFQNIKQVMAGNFALKPTDLKNFFYLMKRWKHLKSFILDISKIEISPIIIPNWLSKVMRLLARCIRSLQFYKITPKTFSEQELKASFPLLKFSHLRKLQLAFELDETELSLNLLQSLVAILSRSQKSIDAIGLTILGTSTSMILSRNVFSMLNEVPNLKKLTIRSLFYASPYPETSTISEDILSNFFEKHHKLEELSLIGVVNLNYSETRSFRIDMLSELKTFHLDIGSSCNFTDDHIEIWIEYLMCCKSLKNLTLILSKSPQITEISMKKFCSKILYNLPDLTSLELHLPAMSTVSIQTFETLLISLQGLRKLETLILNFGTLPLDDFQFKCLFDILSAFDELRELKLEIGSLRVTDQIAREMKQFFHISRNLEKCSFGLGRCGLLGLDFLQALSFLNFANLTLRILRIDLRRKGCSIPKNDVDLCVSQLRRRVSSSCVIDLQV